MVYVILGETASGKTDCALSICRALNLPLISADAYAIYRGFDIGSAKPTPAELVGVEHYFIDALDFGQEISAFEFQRDGRALLDRFAREGRDCVVAGGTFLYVRALLFPYEFPDEEYDHVDVSPGELPTLVKQLLELDPEAGRVVDLKNPRRVERALALARTGTTRSQLVDRFVNTPLYPAVFIRIQTDPDEVRARISARVKKMMADGLVAETERLMAAAPDYAPRFRGIGFREICHRLTSGQSLDGVAEEIDIDTRQYARRQRTFMRHQFPYTVELPRERVVPLVVEDVRMRGGMAMESNMQMDLPLVPQMAMEYTPWIDQLYRFGVRQIGIFTLDRGMVEDFVRAIHDHSPLMQVLVFDDLEIKKGKLPAFSYALPTPEGVRLDPTIEAFIAERGIATRSVEELDLPPQGADEMAALKSEKEAKRWKI